MTIKAYQNLERKKNREVVFKLVYETFPDSTPATKNIKLTQKLQYCIVYNVVTLFLSYSGLQISTREFFLGIRQQLQLIRVKTK